MGIERSKQVKSRNRDRNICVLQWSELNKWSDSKRNKTEMKNSSL
jgi:hypothetical protein